MTPHDFADETEIAILDVPAILAQMNRDAGGAGQFDLHGGKDGIGLPSASRLADGRHMIDVNA
jgi:hypothetical protein